MKFILTPEIGRLATWLRILGYDAAYCTVKAQHSLIIEALRQDRIIVTRNHRIAHGRGVMVVSVSSEEIREQIKEILSTLHLAVQEKALFTRCVRCNQLLASCRKEEIKGNVPEYVYATQDAFTRCPQCRRVYWAGTHWGNVRKIVAGFAQ